MANSALAVLELPEVERTLAFGGISGAFAPVGTPLLYPSIKLVLQNQTNAAIRFSWDGLNPHVTLAAGATFTSDIQTNRGNSNAMRARAGTQFYVQQVSAPSSGSVYISSFYGWNINSL